MTPAAQPDDFAARIEKLRQTQASFRAKWHAWALMQDQVRRCEAHHYDRHQNAEWSLQESWRQGEFVVRYGRCPGCIRDAAETKNKGKK